MSFGYVIALYSMMGLFVPGSKFGIPFSCIQEAAYFWRGGACEDVTLPSNRQFLSCSGETSGGESLGLGTSGSARLRLGLRAIVVKDAKTTLLY